MLILLLSLARRLQTRLIVVMSRNVRSVGVDLHLGARTRLWAPVAIDIGDSVYIGKDVLVECNAEIGDYVMIANRVALVGRHDHDFRTVGVPVRFSPWVGSADPPSPYRNEKVTIEPDVWLGFGAVVLSGVRIGRGAIVAAGSVVTRNVAPYAVVGGNPAHELGRRFAEESEIAEHERRIQNGKFLFSEKGYEHWIVKPGDPEQ